MSSHLKAACLLLVVVAAVPSFGSDECENRVRFDANTHVGITRNDARTLCNSIPPTDEYSGFQLLTEENSHLLSQCHAKFTLHAMGQFWGEFCTNGQKCQLFRVDPDDPNQVAMEKGSAPELGNAACIGVRRHTNTATVNVAMSIEWPALGHIPQTHTTARDYCARNNASLPSRNLFTASAEFKSSVANLLGSTYTRSTYGLRVLWTSDVSYIAQIKSRDNVFQVKPADRVSAEHAVFVCVRFVSQCSSTYCGNSGTCQQTARGPVCSCQAGYFGDRCEQNYCASNPCNNGGTCSSGPTGYQCACPSEHTGPTCNQGTAGYCQKSDIKKQVEAALNNGRMKVKVLEEGVGPWAPNGRVRIRCGTTQGSQAICNAGTWTLAPGARCSPGLWGYGRR